MADINELDEIFGNLFEKIVEEADVKDDDIAVSLVVHTGKGVLYISNCEEEQFAEDFKNIIGNLMAKKNQIVRH